MKNKNTNNLCKEINMYKKAIIMGFIFLTFSLTSQTVDDTPLTEVAGKYIEIVGESVGKKVEIYVDYGQKYKFINSKRRLKDDKGKDIKFDSMIDALNFFDLIGYDFINAYAISHDKDALVYHYILKKRD